MFLLLLNVFLLAVGCLMDIYSATVVVVPLIAPVGQYFGIDPFHLGIIFLTNLELGYLTPPVGMNLFLASYRFNRPLPEVYRAALPFLAIRAVGVLLVTYAPALTQWLPSLLFDG
jgi:TRAP-type C4-dicarboxylate transport system permease large subunit